MKNLITGALLALLLVACAAYAHDNEALEARVLALEADANDFDHRLHEHDLQLQEAFANLLHLNTQVLGIFPPTDGASR